jgi:hypothetical protein
VQPRRKQQLLAADEALVFFLTGDEESYVFSLTREAFEWRTIPLGGPATSGKVTAFRHGLDVDALRRGLGRIECTQAEAEKRGLSRIECGRVLANECAQAATEGRGLGRAECAQAGELFDLGLAHELYETLLGPVEALIRDKRHLMVVPSGALTALPFHLLVTEQPVVAVTQVNAPRDRRLSGCGLAAQAACCERAALGGEPQRRCARSPIRMSPTSRWSASEIRCSIRVRRRRDHSQAPAACRLSRRLFRHSRARCRRHQRPCRTIARAFHPGTIVGP